jgi:hypothetical protein
LNLADFDGKSNGDTLLNSDFATDANKFLTVLETGSTSTPSYVNYRDANNKQALDIKYDAMTVTFSGSGYITFSITSTGGDKTSTFALKDKNGNYLVAETELTRVSSGTEEGAYTVSTTAYAEITFRIDSAGTYTICSPQATNKRVCRIGAITMVDIVYEY